MRQPTSLSQLKHAFEDYVSLADLLAGEPDEMSRRAYLFYCLTLDSKGNYWFPAIWAHTSVFAQRLFKLPTYIPTLRWPWQGAREAKDTAGRQTSLETLSQGLMETNRTIFVAMLAQYYFAKHFGQQPEASEMINPKLLTQLNLLHQRIQNQQPLTPSEQEMLYSSAVQHEQEHIVQPAWDKLLQNLNRPVLKWLLNHPVVSLPFFPYFRAILFNDFSDLKERLQQSNRIFHVALGQGLHHLECSLLRRMNAANNEAPKQLHKTLEQLNNLFQAVAQNHQTKNK